jgi:multicomponent Na+:H+ antiporter subunit D
VGVVVHLVGHAVTKGGFYLAAGALVRGYGASTVDDYAGLGGRAPLLSVAVAVFALGLIGIPPTVGFAGKLYVLLGTVEGSAPVAGAVVLASTLASLTYFGRLLQRMFVESPPGEGHDPDAVGLAEADGGRAAPPSRPSTGAVAVVVAAAILTVVLGVGAAGVADLVEPTIRGMVS